MRQALIALALFAGALAPFVIAPHLGPPTHRLRGELLSVTPAAGDAADTVTLRTADGKELAFEVHPQVELTLAELEDLQRYNRPVNIEYRSDGQALVALDITPAQR